MKNTFFISMLVSFFLISCKKDEVKSIENISLLSTDGSYTFDPVASGGDTELVGSKFITLELGQPYTELGAYIVDTSGVYDANGNLVDSVFNSRPEITPDLTTEGVKSAVYFFTNGNHQECSIVRYIIVYKKQSNPPTGDISGLYKYSTAYNNVTKITDGVYYFDNVLNSTSVYRKGVPALFYQTTDSTFDIINQYFSRTISHYEQGFSTMLAEDRDLSISGSDEKIIYSSTAPFIKLKYRVYPNTSQIAFGAFGSLTSTNIKSTYFTLNKQ